MEKLSMLRVEQCENGIGGWWPDDLPIFLGISTTGAPLPTTDESEIPLIYRMSGQTQPLFFYDSCVTVHSIKKKLNTVVNSL
jgi:hypothetical protein